MSSSIQLLTDEDMRTTTSWRNVLIALTKTSLRNVRQICLTELSLNYYVSLVGEKFQCRVLFQIYVEYGIE